MRSIPWLVIEREVALRATAAVPDSVAKTCSPDPSSSTSLRLPAASLEQEDVAKHAGRVSITRALAEERRDFCSHCTCRAHGESFQVPLPRS